MRFLDHDAVNALELAREAAFSVGATSKPTNFHRPLGDYGRKRWPDTEITSFLRWHLAVRDSETTIERWSEWWALDRPRAEEAA